MLFDVILEDLYASVRVVYLIKESYDVHRRSAIMCVCVHVSGQLHDRQSEITA